MATQRCNSDEAFNILRTVSQHRNIPIRQVAADLVAKTSETPLPPDHPQPSAGPLTGNRAQKRGSASARGRPRPGTGVEARAPLAGPYGTSKVAPTVLPWHSGSRSWSSSIRPRVWGVADG